MINNLSFLSWIRLICLFNNWIVVNSLPHSIMGHLNEQNGWSCFLWTRSVFFLLNAVWHMSQWNPKVSWTKLIRLDFCLFYLHYDFIYILDLGVLSYDNLNIVELKIVYYTLCMSIEILDESWCENLTFLW